MRRRRKPSRFYNLFSDRLKGYVVSPPVESSTWMTRLESVFGGLGKARSEKASGMKSGLYIHGKVGRGKSMLMDFFMEHVSIIKKRRVHFHQFMLEIHERLNQLRQGAGVPDIMDSLVRGIAAETTLLAFDEFHVQQHRRRHDPWAFVCGPVCRRSHRHRHIELGAG